jgi:hypothetical protein
MDDVDAERSRTALRERAPDWRGKPLSRRAPERRGIWPVFETSSEPTSWLFNLVLLVALCVLAMAIVSAALRQWRPGLDTTASNVVTSRSLQSAAAAASPAPLQPFDELTRSKAEQQANQRRRDAVQQHEKEEAERRRIADREARREREWSATYKKPPECEDSQPTIDSVGCANDYVRARRAFDERFASTNR